MRRKQLGKLHKVMTGAALLLLLSACGEKEQLITETVIESVDSSLSENRGITIYYVEGNKVVTRADKLQPKQPDSITACIEEVMNSLPLTEGITFQAYTMGSENAVTLNFLVDEGISLEQALLTKAAVVSTVSQIRNIGAITLSTVTGSGEPEEETLLSSSFYYYDDVVPTGQNNGRITLYLPGDEEKKLEPSNLAVTLTLDVSVEEEVIRQLLERNVFAEGTKLLSISVTQRVAYVDLTKEFLQGVDEVQIASLVDSVVALPHINSVQILIDGEKMEEIGGVDTHVPLRFFQPSEEEEG